MLITEQGFKVKWNHDREKRETICTLSRGSVTSNGHALCSPNDNFNKDVGRKVSLSRALESFDKEERTHVWDNYRKLTKEPRW